MPNSEVEQPFRSGYRLLICATLLLGAGLRVALFVSTPPEIAYDNHIDVALYHVRTGHLPEPDRLWQAYQPPLYHLLGSAVYRMVAGTTVTDRRVIAAKLEQEYGTEAAVAFMASSDADPNALPIQTELARQLRLHRAGKKAIQAISLLAGVGTLLLLWAGLAHALPASPMARWFGLLAAALLPRLIYMSAMATNDSLCYLCVTLSAYLLLRFLRRSTWRICLACGAACGLSLLTKATGLVVLPCVVIGVGAELIYRLRRRTGPVRLLLLQWAAMLGLALVVGIWPYARLAVRYGNPFVSNVELIPPTQMTLQPPGAGKARFACFNAKDLWARPFIHTSNVNCWPLAIYARTWFDYEPWFTQWRHETFTPFYRLCNARLSERRGTLWANLLDWPDRLAPKALVWQARLLYLLGLPISLLLAVGLIGHGRRHLRPAGLSLLSLFVFALVIGLAQAWRLPYFSSFKAAFLLTALLPLAVWTGSGADRLSRIMGSAGRVAVLALAVLLATAVTVHFGYVSVRYAGRHAIWSDRSFATAHWRQGQSLRARGKADQATNACLVAARLAPQAPEPLICLGLLSLDRGQLERAAEYFNKALASWSDSVQARAGLATAYHQLRRFDQALEVLRQGLSQVPDDPTLSSALARLLATCPEPELRDLPESLRLATGAARATDFQDPSMLLTLAIVHAAAGDLDQAQTFANQARQLARAAGQEELADRVQQYFDRHLTRRQRR